MNLEEIERFVMNKLFSANKTIVLTSAVAALAVSLFVVILDRSSRLENLEQLLTKQAATVEAEEKLGQYAINMMMATYGGKQLSDARKQSLARQIVKVTTDVFTTEDQRRAFIMVIAIESQFQKFAQSPTGPKGLAQVAKRTFVEALGHCGMKNVHPDDVWDSDLNLYAGACYFRAQLEDSNGDLFIAAVRYNQGPASKEAKEFAKTGSLTNVEALRYIAKVTFYRRTVDDKKKENSPEFKVSKE